VKFARCTMKCHYAKVYLFKLYFFPFLVTYKLPLHFDGLQHNSMKHNLDNLSCAYQFFIIFRLWQHMSLVIYTQLCIRIKMKQKFKKKMSASTSMHDRSCKCKYTSLIILIQGYQRICNNRPIECYAASLALLSILL
jgi:hypothetical protein